MSRSTKCFIVLVLLFGAAVGQTKVTSRDNTGPTITAFEPSVKSFSSCGPSNEPDAFCATNRRTSVTLEVTASSNDDQKLTYSYSTTVGEIIGEGRRVTWNLEGAPYGPLTATATVVVRNSEGREAKASTTVNIVRCASCVSPGPPCATFAIKAWDKEAHRGERIRLEVQLIGHFSERPDYTWSITGGRVVKGQHTEYVQVLVTGDIDTNVTAKVEISGLGPVCSDATTASHSLPIRP